MILASSWKNARQDVLAPAVPTDRGTRLAAVHAAHTGEDIAPSGPNR
jgi:hypothetical protein